MYCRTCLYCLNGIAPVAGGAPGCRCPECGGPFDPNRPATFLPTAQRPPRSTWLRRILMVCSAYPVAWMSLPYLCFIYARLRLGRWPMPHRDDPTGSWLAVPSVAYLLGFYVAVVLVLAALVAVILAPLLRPRGWWWLVPLVIAAWAAAIVLLASDPWHALAWLMD